ncbi:MAG: AAA family ATPase, partial [Methylococcales bacterium]|nr:AAA family ATPase [Methylococcales bacterium]
MLKEILIEQNPHWSGTKNISIVRDQLHKIIDYLPLKQIITISGIRRCGKSTLAWQAINYLIDQQILANNILFVNLEQPYFIDHKHNTNYLNTIYDEYLKMMNPQGRVYVIFDEIQFFQNWQVFIKSKYENQSIKFIITGSNSSLLSNDLNTLLSGRSLNVHLDTFSFTEFLRSQEIEYDNEVERIKNRIAIARAKEE